MSTVAKDILAKIKATFFGEPVPAPAPVPVPTPVVASAPASYNVDGAAPVFVDISDDGMPGIDANDKVYSDSALTIPYPDGTYNVTGTQFGFTVAGGVVTTVTDAAGTGPGAPVAAAAPPAPTPVPAPAVPLTQATAAAMYEKFGIGTSADRLTNVETMLKALMEYSFGYQIQQASQQEAIVAYRDSIQALQASHQTFSEAKLIERVAKQDEIIKGLFELAESMVDAPTEAPKTLSGNKKERFDRAEKRDEKFKRIIEGLRAASKSKKY